MTWALPLRLRSAPVLVRFRTGGKSRRRRITPARQGAHAAAAKSRTPRRCPAMRALHQRSHRRGPRRTLTSAKLAGAAHAAAVSTTQRSSPHRTRVARPDAAARAPRPAARRRAARSDAHSLGNLGHAGGGRALAARSRGRRAARSGRIPRPVARLRSRRHRLGPRWESPRSGRRRTRCRGAVARMSSQNADGVRRAGGGASCASGSGRRRPAGSDADAASRRVSERHGVHQRGVSLDAVDGLLKRRRGRSGTRRRRRWTRSPSRGRPGRSAPQDLSDQRPSGRPRCSRASTRRRTCATTSPAGTAEREFPRPKGMTQKVQR